MRYFDRLHPIVAFVYFVFIILIAMISMNPIIVSICYVFGIVFCGMLIGLKKILKSLLYNIPLMIILALTNPMFVHKGETILFFLNDNPVTKEAILYGLFASMMIMSVFYWFKCYSEIMTSDKFIYLFGRVIPKLSLILSMSLAFVPKLKRKFKEIDEAQKALGIYATQSYVDKIRSKFRVLSILLTNSLENSIETADSMRSRGYGLKGRSSYAIYQFNVSDYVFMGVEIPAGIAILILIFIGFADFDFYPVISNINLSVPAVILYVLIILLAGISIMLEIKENVLWRYLKSKI